MLTLENKLQDLERLLALGANRFPTRIPRKKAVESVGPEILRWFVERDIFSLSSASSAHYGLVDEFLRIRLMLDMEQSEQRRKELEAGILERVSVEEFAEAELASDDEDVRGYSSPSREDVHADEDDDESAGE